MVWRSVKLLLYCQQGKQILSLTRRWAASSGRWICRHFHRFRKPVHLRERIHRKLGSFLCELRCCCKDPNGKVRFPPCKFPPSACICLDMSDHLYHKLSLDHPGNGARICYLMISCKPFSLLPPLLLEKKRKK